MIRSKDFGPRQALVFDVRGGSRLGRQERKALRMDDFSIPVRLEQKKLQPLRGFSMSLRHRLGAGQRGKILGCLRGASSPARTPRKLRRYASEPNIGSKRHM